MNKLLLYSFFVPFLAQATGITTKDNCDVSQKLDSAHVTNEYLKIYDYDVNHVLHILNHDAKNLETNDQMNTSQLLYNEHKTHLKGSSIKGAAIGFWVSKLAVHAAAQIAYAVVAGATALVYPPAAPVVYCSLQFTFAALVEVASNMVAYGIALALGATALT